MPPLAHRSDNRIGAGIRKECNLGSSGSGEEQARIGIYSMNRPEWIKCLMAAFSQRIVAVPLYDTLGPDAVKFIVDHAELTTVACERSKLASLLKGTSKVTLLPSQSTGTRCRDSLFSCHTHGNGPGRCVQVVVCLSVLCAPSSLAPLLSVLSGRQGGYLKKVVLFEDITDEDRKAASAAGDEIFSACSRIVTFFALVPYHAPTSQPLLPLASCRLPLASCLVPLPSCILHPPSSLFPLPSSRSIFPLSSSPYFETKAWIQAWTSSVSRSCARLGGTTRTP